MLEYLNKLNLIEDLTNEGLSNKLIESVLYAEDDNMEFVITCETAESLHNALASMSETGEQN